MKLKKGKNHTLAYLIQNNFVFVNHYKIILLTMVDFNDRKAV